MASASPSSILEQARHQAKILLQAARAADPKALARLRATIPQLSGASDEAIAADLSRRHVHRVIAREYGFDQWPDL